MSIAAATAGDKEKDKGRFTAGPASSYSTRQTVDRVTIASVAYAAEEQAQQAFGKVNPNKYGVLPVLVVIENGYGKTLRLDLDVRYIDAQERASDNVPPREVPFLGGPSRPRMPGTSPNPLPPIPLPRVKKRTPLDTWEIEGRAFTTRMLPAGESAHGFFYFQVRHLPGARLFLKGVKDAASGQEFFYFEIPLDQGAK